MAVESRVKSTDHRTIDGSAALRPTRRHTTGMIAGLTDALSDCGERLRPVRRTRLLVCLGFGHTKLARPYTVS
jgi:hypothetical protein